MRYLVNESVNPHFNLAFDEYCLESSAIDEPVFYLWRNAPSVIIGLNQNAYGEADLRYLEENGIILARRVTGGGAVYHDLSNLNYSFVGKSSEIDPASCMTLIRDALKSLGVPAQISGRNDILVDGLKVSGYARRVWKDRTLIHGTLMYDVDLEALRLALGAPEGKLKASGIASVRSKVANLKDYLPAGFSLMQMKEAIFGSLSGGDKQYILPESFVAEVAKREKEKFSTPEWVFGRSPATEFRRKRKFACGTVELFLSVKRGVISEIHFGGDFIGSYSALELEEALTGAEFQPSALSSVLRLYPVSNYFDGMTQEEFVDFVLEPF